MTKRINNVAFLFSIAVFTAALTFAQTPKPDEAATPSFATQLQFIGQEPYDVNGAKGTRYKLSVTNRAAHPDFLWQPTGKPCGKNANSSRTWVEIFGSTGDKRLAGFCALRSSEDLAHLWFTVPSGEKGPPCVHLVMTDRQTGKKYESNRVCSRSFTVVRGSLSAGGQQQSPAEKDQRGWIEVQGWDMAIGDPESARVREAGTLKDDDKLEASEVTNKTAKMAKPDLIIRQFLFPPANDKALRVQIENQGNPASGACRLILTVRKINGTSVGRTTHVNIPALTRGKKVWLVIDAKSILPNNVSLQSTTFKVNADATGIVAESDERNNEVWHGLSATAAIGQALGEVANDGDEDAPGKPETSDTQQLSGAPSEKKKLGCLNVSRRWQVCGSTNFKNKFVAGVGISFNEIDPNGRVLVSRTYENCSKLAADKTIPADLRAKAAGPCRQTLQNR